MTINDVFIKAKKQIMHEIEQKEQKGEKANQERIDLKIIEFYTSTEAYGLLCFQNMANNPKITEAIHTPKVEEYDEEETECEQ